MKKHTSDNTHPSVFTAAVMGDEPLTREVIPVLEAHGIEVIPVNDRAAISARASRLTAVFELTILSSDEKKDRLQFLDAHVHASVPIISSSVTVTALTQAQWLRHRARLIGFSGFPTLFTNASLVDLAPSPYTAGETVRAAREVFTMLGKETLCVQDRTGLIVPAILAQIVNEALMAVQQNVASARDIDAAMKLAAGYPLGPVEWGEKIGFACVAALLDARRHETGEERWRTSPLLRQLAAVGTFWHEPPQSPEYVQERLQLESSEAITPALQAGSGAPARKKQPKKKKA